MIDTHSHIDMLSSIEKSVMESIDNNVEYIVLPSSSPENFKSVIEVINTYDTVYGALGVHPEETDKFDKNTAQDIFNLVKNNKKLIAIGEIGLDYYWDKTTKEKQIQIFKTQLEVALSLDLPVLIHDREAHEDTFNILSDYGMKKVILHCFSGSSELAKKCVDKGWLLGIGGVVTFKNSRRLKEVVKEIPLEYLVLETDAPYLTPHPFRGEENSPKYLKFIAKEIANLKDTAFENVDTVTTANAKRFFDLK